MIRVVIIGGGWAGCAASLTAGKSGAEVILLERTDMLLGCGLAGGIMRNNGRFTAAEELRCLGGGDLIELTDNVSRHTDLSFPGHKHVSLYDTTSVEPRVRKLLKDKGIEIRMTSRVTDVVMRDETHIDGLVLADETVVHGDVFIETTGSAGSMGNCSKYGNGCTMCVLRCPSFGPRTSVSRRAGCEDMVGLRDGEQYGSLSGSCELNKESLSEEIREKLRNEGGVVLPVPENEIDGKVLKMKACRQYALPEFASNIVLLDTGGRAKMMMPFFPLEKLRQIPGLERAVYEFSGGQSNSVRFLSRAQRDNTLQVKGVENLFCAGEKSGLFVGHTEAMVTGSLAGYNSVRHALGLKGLELPAGLASGDLIAYENRCTADKKGLKERYTFSGGIYFERMKKMDLYTTDKALIKERVEAHDLSNIYENNKGLGNNKIHKIEGC